MTDYKFYRTEYKGEAIVSVSEFIRLSARASAYVNSFLGGDTGRASPKNIQLAICAVAEAWQTNEQGGELLSQSVGSWSKTYTAKPISNEERLFNAAKTYLHTTRWV